jgi:hypothetical protein
MLRRRCRVQGGAEIPKPGGRYLRGPDVTVFSKQIGHVATDAVLYRVGLQKLARTNLESLSARTSAFTLPKVVSGLCLIPLQKAWMMSPLKRGVRGRESALLCSNASAPAVEHG